MRRLHLLILMVTSAALGLGTLAPVAVAAPGGPDPWGGIERVVFVHYPRGARPEAAPARSANATSCPNPTTCPDYKYSGYHWDTPNLPVPWVVNYANSDGDAGSFGAAVAASFSAWDAKTAAGLFGPAQEGNCTASSLKNLADGVNCVRWEDISDSYPGAIAVTFIWRSRLTKHISEVDTVMGSQHAWTYDSPDCDVSLATCNPTNTGRTSYDVQDILIHEVGHWLMLNDLYKSRDSELTMYGYGSLGERKKDSLGYGDVLGVQGIYGP